MERGEIKRGEERRKRKRKKKGRIERGPCRGHRGELQCAASRSTSAGASVHSGPVYSTLLNFRGSGLYRDQMKNGSEFSIFHSSGGSSPLATEIVLVVSGTYLDIPIKAVCLGGTGPSDWVRYGNAVRKLHHHCFR